MSRDIVPFGLRMPPDLKALVEHVAHENGRSMNAQIIFMLNRYFELERVDAARQYETARDKRIAEAAPQDLPVGDRILKEFNEQQTAMLQGLLVKHGVLPKDPSDKLALVQTSRDALLKPLETVRHIAERGRIPSRTPKIPGQNAPKEGMGAAPKEAKAPKSKIRVQKRRVVAEDKENNE
ncbi:Arc family DNA-binding protein [Achromobacter spanius]|uniref:Arc family DNA-binding protein n=1 Tax=Achromobacter spanius TaxID=217203 RepID=UPI003A9405A8